MGTRTREMEKTPNRMPPPRSCNTTTIAVNGKTVSVSEGYTAVEREWKDGDVIEIILDMRTEVVRPIVYGGQMICARWVSKEDYVIPEYDEQDNQSKHRLAFRRGPLMLAQENRLGYDVETPVDIDAWDKEYVDTPFADSEKIPYKHMVAVKLPLKSGEYMTVTDYASAGKLWDDDTKLSVWMLTDGEAK